MGRGMFSIVTIVLLWALIGVNINTILKNRKKVATLEELVELYKLRENELEEEVNYYFGAWSETLIQNIELKKKLDRMTI